MLDFGKKILVLTVFGGSFFPDLGVGSVWNLEHLSKPVASAHKAYLENDSSQILNKIKNALMSATINSIERENLLDLYSKVQADTCGKDLQVDYRLPFAVSKFSVKQGLVSRGISKHYNFRLSGHQAAKGAIRDLKLLKFPNEVVMHKNGRRGNWYEGGADEGNYFELELESRDKPLDRGLYLFSFEMDDGTSHDGWFILSNLSPKTSPEVISPRKGEEYESGQPEFKWKEYISDQFQGCEKRKADVHLVNLPYQDPWTPVWATWGLSPETSSVVLGQTPYSEGVSELNSGRYWFSLRYIEKFKFGPLRMVRISKTSRAFSVK